MDAGARSTFDNIVRAFLFLAAFSVSIWGLIAAKEFLIPFCFAALLAMLMVPIVRILRRIKLPEWASVLIATILLFLPLLGLVSFILIEVEGLIKNWPAIYASARATLESMSNSSLLARFHLMDHFNLAELQGKVSQQAGTGAIVFFTALRSLLTAGTQLILVLSFAILMLAARVHLRRSFEAILSVEASPERAKMLDGSLSVLEKFLVARVIIIAFVAIADFIILKLFGVSYAVILSVLLGFSTLLPVIGFFAGVIPPLLVIASQGETGIAILGLFASLWAISSLQDHFLTPKLIGQKLNLNFLATFIAVFAGERIWGLSGMFLSIPALGLLRVLLSASNELKPWARLVEDEHVAHGKVAREIKHKAQTSPPPARPTPAEYPV